MKSFFFTLLLFVLMLSAIWLNAVYLDRLTEEMLLTLDSLPNGTAAAAIPRAEKLYLQWQKARDRVTLSVCRTKIDRVDDALVAMRVYFEQRKTADYLAARETLRGCIVNLRE
ncbi:MAG: DUF4363 family protein [Clostridia bacterium]|nr:DUF4363 family protein [Clostridia bacterium]